VPATRVGLISLFVVLSFGVGIAASTAAGPVLMLGAAIAAAAVTIRAYWRVPMVVLATLVVFAGYVLLNRNFAELQIRLGTLPVYIGELLLAVMLPWAILNWPTPRRALSTFWLALAMWLTYAAGRLLAGGLAEYGLNAIRDFALAYYALFIVVGYALWPAIPRRLWTVFFTILFIAILPVQAYVVVAGPFGFPIPGSEAPTYVDRQDVMAVSLIVAATFFLLVLRAARMAAARIILSSLALALVIPQEVRAATIGAGVLLGVFALQRRWGLLVSLLALPLAAYVLISAAGIEIRGRNGSSSPEVWLNRQISTVSALVGGDAASVAQRGVFSGQDVGLDTVAWRLAWWNALIDDIGSSVDKTFFGRGFGSNLTEPLGFQPDPTNPRLLRSPHNFVLTLLARTGLVGLVLWLGTIAMWLLRAFTIIRAATRAGRHEEADYVLWLTAYPVAIIVAAMFGVVLEGPYGAIPCYLLIGMSMRAAEALGDEVAQAHTARDAALTSPGRWAVV
jgi:hypothetical protein